MKTTQHMRPRPSSPTDTTPLLVESQQQLDTNFDSLNDDNDDRITANEEPMTALTTIATYRGQATVLQTVLNITKTCMGTGILALAYACQQGGWLLYVLGLIMIAGWNIVTIQRLIQCLDYIPSTTTTTAVISSLSDNAVVSEQALDNHVANTRAVLLYARNMIEPKTKINDWNGKHPTHQLPPGTSTLGKVAWYAYGDWGLHFLDLVLVLLLLGIVIAYVSAVLSFVQETPFSFGNIVLDGIVTGLIMTAFSQVPDMGYLACGSALGLFILLGTLMVIAGYGIVLIPTPRNDPIYNHSSLPMWPISITGVSHWFGIVVFGYGVVPLTYNLHESMKVPKHFVRASVLSHIVVALTYMVVGVGFLALFPNLESDVLQELPSAGILPVVTRLAMTLTVLMTAPLLIVPCAELLEGKYKFNHTVFHRAAVRLGVVSVGVLVAVGLPSFVEVLSFVGCFCVATVSFITPPLLHLRLVYLAHRMDTNATAFKICGSIETMVDVLLLLLGVSVTVITSVCTIRS